MLPHQTIHRAPFQEIARLDLMLVDNDISVTVEKNLSGQPCMLPVGYALSEGRKRMQALANVTLRPCHKH